MIAVTENLLTAVRQSLQAATSVGAMTPIDGMSGHFCSLGEVDNTPVFKFLFPVDVDGEQVFVYIKLA